MVLSKIGLLNQLIYGDYKIIAVNLGDIKKKRHF